MTINGTTTVFGILGDPVAHSLSPRMHNAALAALGLDAVYVPFRVAPVDLAAAVAGLRALRIRGVSVTVPHKETILPFLDEIDPAAARIGAVNTVLNRDGRLTGYNTDATGLLRALREVFAFAPLHKRIALIGAGGAARAALVALASGGATAIIVVNRSLARAVALVEGYRRSFPECDFSALALDDPALAEALAGSDLLVNTSAVGLKGESFEQPLAQLLPDHAVLFDMVYSATTDRTPLVAQGEAAGIRAADGRTMLVAQGEEAFLLWTGMEPPAELMRAALNLKAFEI